MKPQPLRGKSGGKLSIKETRLDGKTYIEVLRSRPGKPIPASALFGWDQTCPYKYVDDDPRYHYIKELDAYYFDPELPIPKTDRLTINEVGRALEAIRSMIQTALDNNDLAAVEDLRDLEMKYEDYLMETSTPSGDIKQFSGHNEKARRKIRQAVNYYLKKLDGTDPAEAQRIRSCVVIGNICMWSDS